MRALTPILPTLFACLLAACVATLPGPNSPALLPILPGYNLGVPPGYCLDKGASRIAEGGSALLLGRCTDQSGAIPAVLRVTVGAPGSASALGGDPAALAAYFGSPAGRAALSPSGNPGEVQLLSALAAGPDFLLHVRSAREGDYWRALAGIGGRLVSVSALGAPDIPLSSEDSRKVVDLAMAAQRRANAAN